MNPRRTFSLLKINWKSWVQETNTDKGRKKQARLWNAIFNSVCMFARFAQPLALVLLAVFVVNAYTLFQAGLPLPPLTGGLFLMAFGYPMAWLLEFMGIMGRSLASVLFAPDTRTMEKPVRSIEPWDEQERRWDREID